MKTPRQSRCLCGFRGVLLRSAWLEGLAVSKKHRSCLVIPCLLILGAGVLSSALAASQDQNQAQSLDRQFQSAVTQYNAGRLAEAASQLEALLPRVPKSFEVHELLGLTYAGQSQDAKAIEQLQIAVQLKPDSAAARTNLAASLFHSRMSEQAEEQFRK